MLVNWSKFEDMSRFKSFEIKIPVSLSLEALQALDCWEDPTKLWTHVTPIEIASPSKHDSTQHYFSLKWIPQQGHDFANLIQFSVRFWFSLSGAWCSSRLSIGWAPNQRCKLETLSLSNSNSCEFAYSMTSPERNLVIIAWIITLELDWMKTMLIVPVAWNLCNFKWIFFGFWNKTAWFFIKFEAHHATYKTNTSVWA